MFLENQKCLVVWPAARGETQESGNGGQGRSMTIALVLTNGDVFIGNIVGYRTNNVTLECV